MSMDRQSLDGPTLLHLTHRQRVQWHDHAENQLVYPSTGLLQVSTTAGSWVVPPHRAIWLPAAVAHSHRAYGATQMRGLAFSAAVRPDLDQPTVVEVSGLLREIILELTDNPALPPADRADLHRIALRQLTPAPALRFHLPQPRDVRLRDVTDLLTADPGDERTLAELGGAVGVGERTLSRLFRRETGLTFPQWRAQLRLHHSLTLLAIGQSVTATAIACGYQNPSAFIAAFRETFGTTPAAHHKSLRR
jgi:AraC-like DNA-binding protein